MTFPAVVWIALDTLAAAYANAGQFPKAIETAEPAVDIARNRGDHELARRTRRNVALYEIKRLLRE